MGLGIGRIAIVIHCNILNNKYLKSIHKEVINSCN